MIAFDLETTLVDQFERAAPRIRYHVPTLVCMSWSDDGQQSFVTTDYKEIEAKVHTWVADGETLVAHNAAFDVSVLMTTFPELPLMNAVSAGKVLDSVQLARIRNPERPRYSLADLVRDYFGVRLDKGDVRIGFTPGRPLTDAEEAYAMQDAYWTWHLASRLLNTDPGADSPPPGGPWKNRLIACSRTDFDYDVIYSQAAIYTWLTERAGMRVDPEKLEELIAAHRQVMMEQREGLYRQGFGKFTRLPKSTTSAGRTPPANLRLSRSWQYGSGRMWRLWKGVVEDAPARFSKNTGPIRTSFEAVLPELPDGDEVPRTPKGELSIDAKFWGRYKVLLSEPLNAYLSYIRSEKLYSSYLHKLEKVSATRVHPRMIVGHAETGRWSARGPAIQTIPKGLRGLFVPDVGCTTVTADYKSLELYTLCHVLAQLDIRGALYDMLDSGVDVHVRTAQMLFEVTAPSDEQRQRAKVLNFGIPGGLGARMLHVHGRNMGIEWTADESAYLRHQWLEVFSDVQDYFGLFACYPPSMREFPLTVEGFLREIGVAPDATNFEIKRAMNGGRIYDIMLPSGRMICNRTFTQGTNAMFQGTGADVITLAYVMCMRAGLDVRCVVHDSIVCNAATEPQREARRLEEIMAAALATVCPGAPAATVKAKTVERGF